MSFGIGIGIGMQFSAGGGASISAAAAMLADYDDGMAIDWLSSTLAVKESGVLTYDGTIADFPSATVTGSIDPGANDYVLVDSSNSLIIDVSGIPLTAGRGSLVQTLKGGFDTYNPFWMCDVSPLNIADSISLITFGTSPRLRIADSAGGAVGSAIPVVDVSNSANTYNIGMAWQTGTGCRCTVDGSTTHFDGTLGFSWTEAYLGFGGVVSGAGSRLIQTLWLPTYSSEATLAALTA